MALSFTFLHNFHSTNWCIERKEHHPFWRFFMVFMWHCDDWKEITPDVSHANPHLSRANPCFRWRTCVFSEPRSWSDWFKARDKRLREVCFNVKRGKKKRNSHNSATVNKHDIVCVFQTKKNIFTNKALNALRQECEDLFEVLLQLSDALCIWFRVQV